MTERGYTEPTTRAQRQRCTALRKNGTPCHNWADEEHDTTLCKIHLRAGPYSRAVPKGFRKQYERARQDPELLSATDETALLRVRISSLLERLTRADGGKETFERLRSMHTSLVAMVEGDERDNALELLERMGNLLRKGETAEQTWEALYDAIERKTVVGAREWKRQVDLKTVITADRAMALIQGITQAVMRHVTDPALRSLIALEIKEVCGGSPGNPAAAPVDITPRAGVTAAIVPEPAPDSTTATIVPEPAPDSTTATIVPEPAPDSTTAPQSDPAPVDDSPDD